MSKYIDRAQFAKSTKLTQNAARCLVCGDVVVSAHRHDFQTCQCGLLSVDGGLEYERRAFRDDTLIEEHCKYSDGTGTFKAKLG